MITAGTTLWRVSPTGSAFGAASFNSTGIADLVDARTIDLRTATMPRQGRFDLVKDPSVCPGGEHLGGQLYVGLSVGAVVAEGILRSGDVPDTGILPRYLLDGLSLSRIETTEDLPVAILDTQAGLAGLNLSQSITGCTWRDYRETRMTGTSILLNTPDARGLRYRCRNGFEEIAVLLIDKDAPMPIELKETGTISDPGWAHDLVVEALDVRFGLSLGRINTTATTDPN